MEFERPRGTRDFLFEEMRQRKHAEDILRNVFENYGFGEVQTPLFEDLKLFTTKSGEEIVDQLYNFKDKGDRDLASQSRFTIMEAVSDMKDHKKADSDNSGNSDVN